MADPFEYGVNYFSSRLGLTPEQARGAVRWMQNVESGLNPAITNPTSGAYGIGQWLGSRKANLFRNYGASPTIPQQFSFAADEMLGPEAAALRALRGTSTEGDAFRSFGKNFERPSPAEYAKATGGYSSGLRLPSGSRPEGYYDSAMNVTLRPEQQEFPMAAALDALLGGKPYGDAQAGEDHPLLMLDSLLGPGPQEGKPGEQKASADGQFIEPPALPLPAQNLFEQEPLRQTEVKPIQGVPQRELRAMPAAAAGPSPLLRSLLDETQPIEPMGKGAAPLPTLPLAQAPTNPASMLDGLLRFGRTGGQALKQGLTEELPKAVGDIGQAVAGLGERAALGAANILNPRVRAGLADMEAGVPPADGKPDIMRAQIPVEPGLRAAGGALDFATGGLLNPVSPMMRAGAQGARTVARETGAAMPGLMASEQGATRLPRRSGRSEPPVLREASPAVAPEAVKAAETVSAEAAEAVSSVVPPAGQVKRAAKGHIRQATGEGRLAKQLSSMALERFRQLTSRDAPAFRDYIERIHRGENPPPPISMQIINHVEGVERLPQGSPLLPLAETLRKLNSQVKLAIQAELDSFEGIENYFTHLWEQKPIFSGWGMKARPGGSGYALKKREIPTVSDGIKQGLTPRYLDPIETELRYIGMMSDYLAVRRAERLGTEAGYIKNENPGNLVPLRGLGGPPKYAPEPYATIWNRFYRPSFYDEQMPNLYHGLLRATNSSISLALTLSGYHGLNIAKETAANALTTAMADVARGRLPKAAAELARGFTVVPQIAKGARLQHIARGANLPPSKLRSALGLDLMEISPLEREIVDTYTQSGGRIFERGHEYAAAQGNFWQAWKRGSLGTQFREDLRTIGGSPDETGQRRALLAVPRASGFVLDQASKLMQTISAPLFDTMIPRVKFAAYADEMESWMRSNPEAARDEVLTQARRVADSIDDRFGEMVQDNMFWNKEARQTLNLLATSLSWEYGSLRAAGGGFNDILHGRLGSSRVRYLAAYTATVGIAGEIYAKLMTGSTVPPQQAFYPPTGGKTPDNKPEIAILPGYEKEPFSWMRAFGEAADGAARGDVPTMLAGMVKGVADEAWSRVNPFWRTIGGLSTMHDFQKNFIPDMEYQTPIGRVKGVSGYVLQQVEPLGMRQTTTKGSAIGPVQRVLGIRPAPIEAQDPQKLDDIKFSMRLKEIKSEIARVQRAAQREGRNPAREVKSLNDEAVRLSREHTERQRQRRPAKPPAEPLRHSIGAH